MKKKMNFIWCIIIECICLFGFQKYCLSLKREVACTRGGEKNKTTKQNNSRIWSLYLFEFDSMVFYSKLLLIKVEIQLHLYKNLVVQRKRVVIEFKKQWHVLDENYLLYFKPLLLLNLIINIYIYNFL